MSDDEQTTQEATERIDNDEQQEPVVIKTSEAVEFDFLLEEWQDDPLFIELLEEKSTGEFDAFDSGIELSGVKMIKTLAFPQFEHVSIDIHIYSTLGKEYLSQCEDALKYNIKLLDETLALDRDEIAETVSEDWVPFLATTTTRQSASAFIVIKIDRKGDGKVKYLEQIEDRIGRDKCHRYWTSIPVKNVKIRLERTQGPNSRVYLSDYPEKGGAIDQTDDPEKESNDQTEDAKENNRPRFGYVDLDEDKKATVIVPHNPDGSERKFNFVVYRLGKSDTPADQYPGEITYTVQAYPHEEA